MKKSMVGVLMGGMVSLIAAVYPAMAEKWVYIGKASTGEEISVDADSISSAREGIRFTYSIGNETLQAQLTAIIILGMSCNMILLILPKVRQLKIC